MTADSVVDERNLGLTEFWGQDLAGVCSHRLFEACYRGIEEALMQLDDSNLIVCV
jgi:hypothetical protein